MHLQCSGMSFTTNSGFSRAIIGAAALIGACCASVGNAQESALHYGRGAVVSPQVFVTDRNGSEVALRSLLEAFGSRVNVVYIFGGGDLGAGQPGHLWCPDSFEDIHILRTLVTKYAGADVGFIAVAAAPVYHSQLLGAPPGVFFNEADDAAAFIEARAAFIDSTMAAFDDGIIPIEPYFDTRYRLKLSRAPDLMPGDGFGQLADWMGAFRSASDTQLYGVPSLWLLSNDGEVLADPFGGNVYHPHGPDVSINYTFADVDAKLQTLLAR